MLSLALTLLPSELCGHAAHPYPSPYPYPYPNWPYWAQVMQFAMKAKSGRSGKGNLIFSEDRGRYIKPMLPKGAGRGLGVG